MKIAHIVSTYPPYQGGIGNVCFYLARELRSLGLDIEVLTPEYGKNISSHWEAGVVRIKPFLVYGNAAWCPRLIRKLNEYDLVHLHYPCFGMVGPVLRYLSRRPRGFKLVVHYHMDTFGSGLKKIFFSVYSAAVRNRLMDKADRIIVTSLDYLKNSSLRDYYVKNSTKFAVVSNGVDLNFFNKKIMVNSVKERFKVDHASSYVLFVGGLDKAHYFKGINYLLKAWKIVVDSGKTTVKLVIVGEGNLKSSYQKMADELGISNKVIFAGKLGGEDLQSVYENSLFLVLPSFDSSEAFGMVLLEAMAYAKPVIASDLPGVRTVVEEGVNGFLTPARSHKLLADKIIMLLFNKELRERMGDRAYASVVEKYQWKDLAAKVKSLYGELIG